MLRSVDTPSVVGASTPSCARRLLVYCTGRICFTILALGVLQLQLGTGDVPLWFAHGLGESPTGPRALHNAPTDHHTGLWWPGRVARLEAAREDAAAGQLGSILAE